ncbi:unnamed protein product [Cylicocyclus nassatus]|uniref:Uncharacterized protein n=1 Tax=Cylicocyclus nassatus TaxID=53992 RepID=A0AA36HD91_CYLNA|nr:unnamed protein product [Cylicocyclus nassatus]
MSSPGAGLSVIAAFHPEHKSPQPLDERAQAETLLERLAERTHHPKRNLIQDLTYTSDAISGPHSLHSVGTFAGRPIETRQRNVFIDNQGVPVPVEN